MHSSSLIALAAGLLAAVSASPLVRRDPSNESGGSQIALSCNGVTLPGPGTGDTGGSGGASYFSSNLVFYPDGPKGQAISPSACYAPDSTCNNCIFDYPGLSSPTNVTACWNPPAGQAGCGIQFQYNGYHFDSQTSEPYCGHTNKFEPFSDDLTAICYFNMAGTVQ